MADKAQLMERGKTYYGSTATADLAAIADNPNVEGMHRIFKNLDPSNLVNKRDAGEVEMIAVRNVSTISLKPKRVVKWLAGKQGSQVDGYCDLAGEQIAGVIDERLPSAGCRDDDICWIAIKGRHLVDTAHSTEGSGDYALTDIAVDAVVIALTGASSRNATGGGHLNTQFINAASTTLALQLRAPVGFALTAKTLGQTNQDMLVDLKIA